MFYPLFITTLWDPQDSPFTDADPLSEYPLSTAPNVLTVLGRFTKDFLLNPTVSRKIDFPCRTGLRLSFCASRCMPRGKFLPKRRPDTVVHQSSARGRPSTLVEMVLVTEGHGPDRGWRKVFTTRDFCWRWLLRQSQRRRPLGSGSVLVTQPHPRRHPRCTKSRLSSSRGGPRSKSGSSGT